MNEIIINSEGNIKIDLTLNPSEITQDGTPTPESPVNVNVIKGNNTITISNSDNTKSQNYSINLGDLEYAKIGDYEDEIYTENGNWYLKENVGKVLLDGSETYNSVWYYPDAPRYGVSTELPNALTTTSSSQFIQMYSNRFVAHKQDDLWTASLYSNGICMRTNYNQLVIKNNDISTPATSTEMINDFKNWISTHNIKVYYPLTTPTITQITDTTLIEQLENLHNNPKTYDNETIIKQVNDGLPFDISYKLDKNIVSVISDINEFLRVNL